MTTATTGTATTEDAGSNNLVHVLRSLTKAHTQESTHPASTPSCQAHFHGGRVPPPGIFRLHRVGWKDGDVTSGPKLSGFLSRGGTRKASGGLGGGKGHLFVWLSSPTTHLSVFFPYVSCFPPDVFMYELQS